MFCSRCGSEITGKSKFCPSCGLDLMATTPVHAIATGVLQELDLVREALEAEYEIIEELGRGGMAMVYRAKDRQLEREVAVKVLPFSLAFDTEFVERFQREARTAAQLEHPNIISIYRVGRSGRVIYFVMKFLRGGSLSNVLGARKKLTPPEIRRLLLEAGGALGYAAQRGIVHRDIKPDNIMFDEFGQSVLTDFGIAKAASGQKLTGTGMSIGTPHYMSPEQARAQPIDGRSDIYSLGVVAYQCLTGTVPYDGEDSFSIGYKHITEPIPTPSLVTADERRIFEVIKRMLMKDPFDRFQSCEELVASFRGQPIAAPGAVRTSAATLVGTGAAVAGAGARLAGARSAPDREPAHDAAGFATGQPAADPPRAARSAAPSRRPVGGDAHHHDVLVGLALGTARRPGRHGRWYLLLQGSWLRPRGSRGADSDATPRRLRGTRATPVSSAWWPGAGRSPRFRCPRQAPSGAHDSLRRGDRAAAGAGRCHGTGCDWAGRQRWHPADRSTPRLHSHDRREADYPGLDQTPPGPHALAISAPRYNFYSDTIVVRPGEIAELTPSSPRSVHPLRSASRRRVRSPAACRGPATMPMDPASTSVPSR